MTRPAITQLTDPEHYFKKNQFSNTGPAKVVVQCDRIATPCGVTTFTPMTQKWLFLPCQKTKKTSSVNHLSRLSKFNDKQKGGFVSITMRLKIQRY